MSESPAPFEVRAWLILVTRDLNNATEIADYWIEPSRREARFFARPARRAVGRTVAPNRNSTLISNKIVVMWLKSRLPAYIRHNRFLRQLLASMLDLAPVVTVILFFQILVIQQPIPEAGRFVWGMFLVVLGLTLFVQGLNLGLFPLGESMAHAFARKGSMLWLLVFAFALGFGTTVAEPALIAVADEAARIAEEGGVIAASDESRKSYALGLRIAVALSVGFAVVVGVIRIVRGWPLPYVIIAGYIGVVVMTVFAPREIIGIAYDSGGVTTSTITVPLVTALGVGLSSSIQGRNPMIDGFGLIAFASLMPMIFVMGYGMIL